MCDCGNRDFEVRNGKLFGEYDGDFHEYDIENYSYCPICGEHLQPERLNPEACDHNGINIMQMLDEKSNKCSKCDSVFTRCDSLNS